MKITFDRSAVERLIVDAAKLAFGSGGMGTPSAWARSLRAEILWGEDGSVILELTPRVRKRQAVPGKPDMPPLSTDELDDLLSQADDVEMPPGVEF